MLRYYGDWMFLMLINFLNIFESIIEYGSLYKLIMPSWVKPECFKIYIPFMLVILDKGIDAF